MEFQDPNIYPICYCNFAYEKLPIGKSSGAQETAALVHDMTKRTEQDPTANNYVCEQLLRVQKLTEIHISASLQRTTSHRLRTTGGMYITDTTFGFVHNMHE
jgi:hypothetical protein